MESYLMMLYVTLDQEKALRNFFGVKGWKFLKPDLSVTTESVGPLKPKELCTLIRTNNSVISSTPSNTNAAKKRKLSDETLDEATPVPPAQVRQMLIKTEDKGTEAVEEEIEEEVKTASDQSVGKNIDGTELPSDDEQTRVEEYNEIMDSDLEELIEDDGDNDDDFSSEEVTEGKVVEGELEEGEVVQGDTEWSFVDMDDVSARKKVRAVPKSRPRKPIRPVEKTGPSILSCKICKFKCKSVTLLRKHMTRHGSTFQVCGTCGIQLNSDEELQEHLKIHVTLVKCGKCGQRVEDLDKHLQNCDVVGENLSCKKCYLEFRSLKELEKHIPVCKVGPYTCDICGAVCMRISSLNRHKKRHDPDGGNYQCQTCGRRFFQKYDLYEHEFVHKPKVRCEACHKMVSNLKCHVKLCRKALAEKALVRCGKCDKVFASLEAKLDHMETCKTQLYQCEICNMSYTALGSLRVHHKKCHAGEEGEFECGVCGQRFHTKYTLQEHEQFHKPKELCKTCGKMVHLTKRHEKSCGVIKANICGYCGVSVRGSVSHLNRHIDRQHRAEKEADEAFVNPEGRKREYECMKCGEKFMYKGWVDAHERECKGFGLARTEEVVFTMPETENLTEVTEVTGDQTTAEEVEVAMMLPSVVQAGEIGSETMVTDLATNTVYIIKH